MDGTFETKKYGADKIALFALFILALLIAYVITVSKSTVKLSEPIKLEHSGLSVSMPTGAGWQSQKQWNYHENAFTISSFFISGPAATAIVHCRYLLAPTSANPQIKFSQKTSSIGGTIEKTDQIQTDTLTIDWAHIKQPQMPLDVFFGTTILPDKRQLDIEVHEATGDAELAEKLFKRIVKSLKFADNQLLNAGGKIVEQIKTKGLNSFLKKQSRQNLFLIKDSTRRTIGFTIDTLIDSTPNAQLNIQAAGYYCIRGRYATHQETFFQSDNSLNEFTWKSKTSSPTTSSRTEIVLDKNGNMTVRKLGPQPEVKNYTLGPAAIPEVFLEQLFSQMLDNDNKKIIVDIIESDGKITPTLISGVEAEETAVAEEAAYKLKLEFLDGRGFYEYIYLDSQKRIFKGLLHQDNIYTIQRTDVEDILRRFPEQADHLLQRK